MPDNQHSQQNSPTQNTPPINLPIVTIHNPMPNLHPLVNANTSIEIDQLNTTITNINQQQVIDAPGLEVVNTHGQNINGDEIIETTFISTDSSNNVVNITENLVNVITTTYDDEQTGPTSVLLNEIKLYAGKIQCSDFHGKGTIDDYNELFVAAAKIATDSKQIQLNVDIEGFENFGAAADELSALFSSFILKLQNVSIIDDTIFLTAVANALRKIWNLSEVFGRFKETILATTTVSLPKSAHDTSVILQGVMDEVNCAMNYINYFVSPTEHAPHDAALSNIDKNIITTAVSTINNWNVLCDQGVTIAMTNNSDIQNIKLTNTALSNKTASIVNATTLLRAKFAQFNLTL
jgi:hypothetical protein